MTFQITASTPNEMRLKIIEWLREQAILASIDGRKAIRQKVVTDFANKRDALNAAASFIEAMEIKSLPKDRKCPNCGEEMI